jgi:ribosomal protein S12 methylthiotransferase accessory factor YcaO
MHVVNLTRNGIDVPIVRAFVPGLRPAWARFAPGRLFDVPLRLGWASNRPSMAALNRVPLMT